MSTVEQLAKIRARLNGRIWLVLLPPVLLAAIFLYIMGLSPEARETLLYALQDYLPIFMFLTLAILLFSGYPVAFVLGGIAINFGLIGYALGMFSLIEFFNFLPRIWGQAAENLVLVSVPAFVFMGIMMERSGIAQDLLYCVQVLLRRVPGALALAVTIMGTILAAMTGIIGASVTMMTALALPTMLRQNYSPALSCGTIAASGTLGILIQPSIMLIIMADLLAISVGNLFMAALMPGLALAVAFFLSPLASAAPDGLEQVTAGLGGGEVAGPLPAPMPDYVVPGLHGIWLATSLAGVLGSLVVFVLAWVLSTSLKRRLVEQSPVRHDPRT